MAQKLELTRQNEHDFLNQHIQLVLKFWKPRKKFFFVELCI